MNTEDGASVGPRQETMAEARARNFGVLSVPLFRAAVHPWRRAYFPENLLSRSPRRSLRMALDAMDDLAVVCERYPDARAELVAALGEQGLSDLHAARETIAAAVTRLSSVAGDASTPT